LSHVIDVRCIHAQITCDEGQWEEDDRHDGEGVDGVVVPIFVRLDLAEVPALQLVRMFLDFLEVGNAVLDMVYAFVDNGQISSRWVTAGEDSVGRRLTTKDSLLEGEHSA